MTHFVERCVHGARGAACKCGGPGRKIHLIPCPADCTGEDNEYALPKTEAGRRIIEQWDEWQAQNWSCVDGQYINDRSTPYEVPEPGELIGPSISAIWTPHEHVPEYSMMKCGYHCAICWEFLRSDEDLYRALT